MKEAIINGIRIEITRTADAVGLFCPMPVVRLKLEIEKIEPNQVIELLADDPGVVEDVPAWCKETGNQCLSIEKNDEGIFMAYVRKRRG